MEVFLGTNLRYYVFNDEGKKQQQYCTPCNFICKNGGIHGFLFSCHRDIYLYVFCVFVSILVFEFVFEFASAYVHVSDLKI